MARNIVTMTVDHKKADKKIANYVRKANRQGSLLVTELGQLGVSIAQRRAPYYTGSTYRAIKLMKGSNQYQSIITGKNIRPDTPGRKIKNFDLTRWMHQSDNMRYGKGPHVKSGDRFFMYSTLNILKDIAGIKARKSFDKIKIK